AQFTCDDLGADWQIGEAVSVQAHGNDYLLRQGNSVCVGKAEGRQNRTALQVQRGLTLWVLILIDRCCPSLVDAPVWRASGHLLVGCQTVSASAGQPRSSCSVWIIFRNATAMSTLIQLWQIVRQPSTGVDLL